MPSISDEDTDLPLVANEFFAYILHLTEIQEPSNHDEAFTEKELRARVSQERTEYGDFNADYVFLENPTEEYVSIGEMDDDNTPQEEFVEMQHDNAWNVINNQVLRNTLHYDKTATTHLPSISSFNARTPSTTIAPTDIQSVLDDVKANKYLSFAEANEAKIDTSMFNTSQDIPLDQRYVTIFDD